MEQVDQQKLTQNQQMASIIANAFAEGATTRNGLINSMLDPRRDIDTECGYPSEISLEQYKMLYAREGLATRAVAIFPEESWVDDPTVTDQPEDKHNDETSEFEASYNAMAKKTLLYSYLKRIDILSGIGQFGVLFLGFSDGETWDKEVKPSSSLELLYFRAFDQTHVDIARYVTEQTDPRYGLPLMYNIRFATPNELSTGVVAVDSQAVNVHYSRILHVADNRESSESHGIPRLRSVFNRMYDLRKILGGSGEMFWKGAFPGYAFEVDPNAGSDFEGGVELDKESLRAEFERYSNGLQRYLALEGVTAKSLLPQVADPSQHVDTQTKAVAICLGVPHRVFAGSEEAKLASSEDTKRWNKRIRTRRERYLTPYILQPLIDQLIALQVLPNTEYEVSWPSLDEETPKQKAETFEIKARAMTQLVAAMSSGAPMSFKDLYELAKEQDMTKEDLVTIVAELEDRGFSFNESEEKTDTDTEPDLDEEM